MVCNVEPNFCETSTKGSFCYFCVNGVGFTVLVTFWLRWVPTADYILRNHYARNVTYLALLNVITRQSQKGELSTLPPSFVYDTVRLLIHGLRTLCHRNRHHRSCHPGKVPPQTTMDDATTSDVSSSSSKEKKTGENFDFFQNKSLGTGMFNLHQRIRSFRDYLF